MERESSALLTEIHIKECMRVGSHQAMDSITGFLVAFLRELSDKA